MRPHHRVRPAVLLLAISMALGVWMSTLPVWAAPSTGSQTAITVSPASTAPSLKPGASKQYNISILNNGNVGYNARVYAAPYHVASISYDPSFTQLPGTTDASAWIKPDKSAVFVPAHETVVVPYTLTIPAHTAPGGYYAVVFVETQPPKNSGVQSRSRIGDVQYITVQGSVRTGGAILTTKLPHFTMATSIPLSLEVSNTGGVHYLTTATVAVSTPFGRGVFTGNFQRYVLPQTIRKISATWKTPALGIFKISRSATIAGRSQSLPDQWIVVVHPWVFAAAVIIVLALAVLLILRRHRRKQDQA